MNTNSEEQEKLLEHLNDPTALGATGKRLAFNVGGEFESKLQGVASDEVREQLEREKHELSERIAQAEAQKLPAKTKRLEVWDDRILVRPLTTPETKNGVIIAESARYLTAEGEVLEVGDGRLLPDGSRLPLRSKVGDIVKYTPYTGSAFKLNDVDVLVLSERDCLGRIYEDE